MKILVAVTNCWKFRHRQQSIRDTWMAGGVPPQIDIKFFLGRHAGPRPELKPDEVVLDCPDDYNGLPFKTREMIRYALANDYDLFFKCDDDTYVQLQRLIASRSWDLGDYVGRKRGPANNMPAPYASGFSYWLTKRAMRALADQDPTGFPAEDLWVGNKLLEQGIQCVADYRYVIIQSIRNTCSHTEGPRVGNDIITACEFDADVWMKKLHYQWQTLVSLAGSHHNANQEQHPLRRVAVMIKTFLRDGYLIRSLAGIKQNLPEAKIVVVDDGIESREKIKLYSKLRLEGHACAWLPFDSGFGAKANEAVKYCDREYVLIGSDDFAFGHLNVRGDVTRMVQTLDEVQDLDIVSGRVNNNPYESTLEDRGDEVFERQGYTSKENCAAGPYWRCDLTVNYSLIRRSLLDRVKWDGDVKIGGGEHGMFYLDVKRSGGKVAYLPGVNIVELPGNVPGWQHVDYPNYRGRARQPGRICAARRGVKKYWMGTTCEVSE